MQEREHKSKILYLIHTWCISFSIGPVVEIRHWSSQSTPAPGSRPEFSAESNKHHRIHHRNLLSHFYGFTEYCKVTIYHRGEYSRSGLAGLDLSPVYGVCVGGAVH
ncbi:predicted protein [Sclerotinia sclerotiorum 1980 UF-70]|uniref:Uncharacterized protein n=1 Tax=Sclerotinia sclerotiorum (strain ATCC 18683 / 1980 / Ss-1) TaxID=665079 RepID=A7EV96_SCLS1|nr:predicted protein [Sclerotinia sclerotiorum 1980 UF-70]EDN93388.1 predicted protein [Sclerotinia sclerotiorum 1980 UF-70]